jgi:RNA polymerase sigma-70 factor (ECF subfamily)
LLARVALGDRAAFASLYKAVSAPLLGVILRIQRDRGQAEDVLQEIFVSIWRAAQGFDAARAQPMTWLTSIARNRAIDSLRRNKTEVATVSALGGDDDDVGPNLVDTFASDLGGPLEMLTQAAQAQALAHCVDALSAEQQQCVALAYYQGLSHSEVAQHLRQPLGTVKSWVRRALMALKDCLGQAVLN